MIRRSNGASRPQCARCQRPTSHCLCDVVTPVSNRTRVLILQHPSESRHPLNTARLAVLGLVNAELRVGEHLPELDAIIGAASSAVLLFPSNDATAQAQAQQAGAACLPSHPDLLIVPDGTWRKARGIVRANPLLNTLPRLDIPATRPSRYRVRKTHEVGALSTIEAIVSALTLLEPGQDFQPVLRPFDLLIEQQIRAMGQDVYDRHHRTG